MSRQRALVEVVAGDAPRNLRIAAADQLRVAVAQRSEAGVDFAPAAAAADDRVELVVAGRADAHAQAVVGQHVERMDVVGGAARHHRVHAAGVVADHAAKRVVRVRRRIGSERQVMRLGRIAQRVEHAAWLHVRALLLGVERDDAVEILRAIDDDGDVAALSGEAGAGAAREHRRTLRAARGDRRDDVLDRARHDDADRHLAVERAVGRVERAAAAVEAHFRRGVATQLRGERVGGLAIEGAGKWRVHRIASA
jgi:hypothetical protein